ncbi:MAG: DUF1847 domain-containing protein [Desulfuromonadaceae bacterium]|nr:DUF1847 domain-containing protein [Desulfuromonadaceae bacterium]
MNHSALAITDREVIEEDCLALYDEQDRQLMKLTSAAKARGINRVEKIVRFAETAGWKRIGIAHCVAVAQEAACLEQRLGQTLEVTRVDCKICRIPAEALVPGDRGTSCNPIGQATLLAERDTELNIAMGLCLGHDLLFSKHSKAPVTTLVVKDRVHGHNPIAALK